MLKIVVLINIIVGTLSCINPHCTTNVRSRQWCERRINEMKESPGYDPTNPAAPYPSNKCTVYGDPSGLFRCELCCASCKFYLGAEGQAEKEVSYITHGAVCEDSTTAKAMCLALDDFPLSTKQKFCQKSQVRFMCRRTCGYCEAEKFTKEHSTAIPCFTTATCGNHSMCNHIGHRSPGQCASIGRDVIGQGNCNCKDCKRVHGHKCKSDSDCDGWKHSCQAVEHKCDCGMIHKECKVGKYCKNDMDCGGVLGTCGFLNKDTDFQLCIAGENCKCSWCPGPIACREDTKPCTAHRAEMNCGHEDYCVSEGNAAKCKSGDTDCKCQCRPKEHTAGDIYKPDGKFAPICIEKSHCTADTKFQCGDPKACISDKTGRICTSAKGHEHADPAGGAAEQDLCHCQCKDVTPPPNVCLGLLTDAGGRPLTCLPSGQRSSCGYQSPFSKEPPAAMGDLVIDVCKPDMETAVCICGHHVGPKYSSKLNKGCKISADCGDKSAICVEDRCVVATVQRITAADYKCKTDADCGYGVCVSPNKVAKCQNGAEDCVCQAAGCKEDVSCGVELQQETCGGLYHGCEGKCLCT